MTNTFFNSKEDYLLYRELFAKAAQNKELTAVHFVFNNLVRGRHITHGFTPCTNKNKLSNGGTIWHGLDHAVSLLQSVVTAAHLIKRNDSESDNWRYRWDKEQLAKFLTPFLDENTQDHELYQMFINLLIKLSVALAKHEKYDSGFGKGRKIAIEIMNLDKKPQNYQEFMEIVEKVENKVKEAA
jgi:hypothetical protein